jgi:hypothetical protein
VDVRITKEIAALAGRQDGLVTRAQLVALGASPRMIDAWIESGRLHRVHQGVYAVGHAAISVRGRARAALLAMGPAAVLSHHSAGVLWRILPEWPPIQHVTTTSRSGKRIPTLQVHRVRALPAQHLAERNGLRTTTVARTLIDLAEVLPADELRRAVNDAQVHRRVTRTQIERVVRECPGRRGIPALRAALGAGTTRSSLEDRFFALLKAAELPLPEINARVDRYEVDFLWRAERLIVETDGWGPHSTRRAFEHDRAKQNRLTLLGYVVLRITEERLTRSPFAVVAEVAAAHSAASSHQ